MKTIIENIIALRKEKNLSQQSLADVLGIKRSRLSSYEQGKATPPINVLQQYAQYFGVDFNTFFKDKSITAPEAKLKVLAITVDNENNENIEFVPVKAFAGYLSSYGDPVYIQELPKFRLPFLRGGTFRAFEIQGDSMLPVPSGSIIVGQYVESLKDLKLGETYIFVTAWHGILFKRVAYVGGEKILLQSDNPLYHSYDLPLEEINEIWKTKVFISTQLPEPPNHVISRLQDSVQQLHEEVRKIKGGEA